MLLVVDCKHKLIQKTPQNQRMNGNGILKSPLRGEKGSSEEKQDMLQDGTTIQVEDPSLPAVSIHNLVKIMWNNMVGWMEY